MARNIMEYLYHKYPDVRVLYVEDERFSREKLLRILNRRFATIHVANDGVEGLQLYKRYHPDLIIVDIKMTHMSGLEMIKKIRELNDKVQVIVTTAQEENDFNIQSIEHNVNHFILKPIDLNQFLEAIHESIQQIKLEKDFAMMDPLTNSFNRSKFHEILASEMRQAEQFDQSFSIIMMSIDSFKNVNDCFGSHVGDKVLVTISTIIQQRIRECDFYARWGDEEFILLIPGTDSQNAAELAESIRCIIEDFSFKNISHLTCNFGIAEYSTKKSKSELIQEAEQALYQSKNKGRNCVTIYNKE
ncbi:diguanylate cyclase domain-containing protein [Neobacillus sp.]|uniref:GGDEF domain-containing protein n=1 Tax=Neobacillus sp. TaxID=2675273 RepID=UPI002897A3E8|nr:diguanylate cyclase [Neobacillus sp.]